MCGDPGVVPPGRYRRGSVSHSWSETIVSENSTTVGASTPERLYTPVDELLSSAAAERQQQVRGASAISLSDDGPYSRTNVFTAEYSDTRALPSSISLFARIKSSVHKKLRKHLSTEPRRGYLKKILLRAHVIVLRTNVLALRAHIC